ncbi:phage tail terminator protein [Pseudogemmobacter sonorensis]|uniref:phage tail terminator protein n=1 Tax=Pseudogemmobacter sonorensis TaxID=2989681 RepID=UPI0036AA958B
MLTLDPGAIRDRLETTVSAFDHVGLARDLGTAHQQTLRWPSAWVVLLAEQAGDVRYFGTDMIEQAITARVGIIMAIRDIADRTGAQAGKSLKPIREAVLLSLCRFVPEAGGQAFRFASGQQQSGIDARGGLFWQDNYTLRFDRRIQIT